MLRHRALAMLPSLSFIAASVALQAAGVRPMMFRLSNVRDFRACPSTDSTP